MNTVALLLYKGDDAYTTANNGCSCIILAHHKGYVNAINVLISMTLTMTKIALIIIICGYMHACSDKKSCLGLCNVFFVFLIFALL